MKEECGIVQTPKTILYDSENGGAVSLNDIVGAAVEAFVKINAKDYDKLIDIGRSLIERAKARKLRVGDIFILPNGAFEVEGDVRMRISSIVVNDDLMNVFRSLSNARSPINIITTDFAIEFMTVECFIVGFFYTALQAEHYSPAITEKERDDIIDATASFAAITMKELSKKLRAELL